jgi:5,10-methylenetetrahydrofolate reductase
MRSGYFIIPSNFAVLGYKNGKALPPDTLKVVLRKEGMEHAEEMIDLMAKQKNHLIAFFAAHPEIKKLKPDEQRELLMKLISY